MQTAWSEKDGDGRNRARRAAAGAEEDEGWRRFRASRLDSLDEDDEGDEAELLPRFDLLGGAPSGGDGRGTAAGRRCLAELGLGLGDGSNWEEKMGR